MTEGKTLKQISEEGLARERAARAAAGQALRIMTEGRIICPQDDNPCFWPACHAHGCMGGLENEFGQ